MDECTETIQTRIFTEDNWKRNWEIGKIVFHEKEKHPLLVEFLDEMINGRQKLNIFFPLCGKNVDMKWLAEKGHTIVGVDISEIGLKQFFEEQSVPFVEEAVPDIPGAKVFKSTSENISLYCCSIYQISDSVIGKFDGIWDRGSLVAINLIERQRYVDIMLSLLNQDCRYLLITVDFNPALIQGPPFFLSDSSVEQMFGSACSIKLLKKRDVLDDTRRKWGLDYCHEKIFLVTPKVNEITHAK